MYNIVNSEHVIRPIKIAMNNVIVMNKTATLYNIIVCCIPVIGKMVYTTKCMVRDVLILPE